MPGTAVPHLVLPALVAAAGTAAPLLVLHLTLAHAMRARGAPGAAAPRWRLRDTALVSPLLLVGLFTGFAMLAHGLGRAASDAALARPGDAHLAGCLIAAAVAFVVAGFGARAVGKLY